MKDSLVVTAGIDYSLTSPAMTSYSQETNIYKIHCFHKMKEQQANKQQQLYLLEKNNIQIYCHKLPNFNNNYEKMIYFTDLFLYYIKESGVNHIAIEDYSFGSFGKVFSIAENTGYLKLNLWKQYNKEPLLISPKSIKKFATGRGNASKLEMIESFEQSTNINIYELLQINKDKSPIKAPITDISDSYFICNYLLSTL